MKLGWLLRNLRQRGRLVAGLLTHGRRREAHPLVANLFLTSRCNARCTYCYVGDVHPADTGAAADKRVLGTKEWLRLIDDLTARGVRYFTLVGGEPLLSPHFDAVVDHLHRRDLFFNVTSNGALVPRKLEILAKASQITISLDGDRESNDRLRGPGWHARALAALDAAAAVGIPVRLNVVVTRANAGQVPYILDLCEQRRMVVTFTPCIDVPEFRREETARWQLSDGEMRAFFRDLVEMRRDNDRIMNSGASIHYMIDYPTTFDRVVMKNDAEAGYYPTPCPYGRFQYHFNEYGEVFPCAHWWNSPDFKAETVFDGGLDRALAKASNLPCQFCSFCNMVDWNEMTRPAVVAQGALMTIRQAGSRKR